MQKSVKQLSSHSAPYRSRAHVEGRHRWGHAAASVGVSRTDKCGSRRSVPHNVNSGRAFHHSIMGYTGGDSLTL